MITSVSLGHKFCGGTYTVNAEKFCEYWQEDLNVKCLNCGHTIPAELMTKLNDFFIDADMIVQEFEKRGFILSI
jgi:hypothetical protein